MSLKSDRVLLFFTGFFIILLSAAMCARNVLASHHKGQIAFTARRGGNYQIYVMDSNGKNLRRLTA